MINITIELDKSETKFKDILFHKPFMSGGDGPYMKLPAPTYAGRGCIHKGKDTLLILDHLSNHVDSYLVDDDSEYLNVRYVALEIVVRPLPANDNRVGVINRY